MKFWNFAADLLVSVVGQEPGGTAKGGRDPRVREANPGSIR